MSTYVCSDIHGNYDAWLRAMKKCEINLENGDNLIILGDLIDRGSKSLECVFYALDLRKRYPEQVTYLMGNHEKMFLDFVNVKGVNDYESYIELQINGQTWLGNGGTQTISSFLGSLPENLVDTHKLLNQKFPVVIEELNNLPYYKIDDVNNYVYVHAGFESNVALLEQNKEELIWIREPFFEEFTPVKNDVLDGKMIVHGHTPVQYIPGYKGDGFYKGRHHICIDGGAAMNKSILILRMEDLEYIQEKIETSNVI